MSEFSDRALVAGSLTGVRSFNVDKYGRLMATQLNVVWTPGDNEGRCLRELIQPPQFFVSLERTFTQHMLYGTSTSSTLPAPPEPKRPAKGHRVGTLDCTCGFYAYFDNAPNTYRTAERLSGLIEGFGLVTVGTRGFRAEKARIKALVIPGKKATAVTERVRANYPDVPVYERRVDALADFPLTPPVLASPHNDPDFWTRETL